MAGAAAFRRVEEELRVVKLTLGSGASVAGIDLADGVNANQVFRQRRRHERGELRSQGSKRDAVLVPMTIAAEPGASKLVDSSIPRGELPPTGSVTTEFRNRVLLSIEGTADPAVIRTGEPEAMIELRAGRRIEIVQTCFRLLTFWGT